MQVSDATAASSEKGAESLAIVGDSDGADGETTAQSALGTSGAKASSWGCKEVKEEISASGGDTQEGSACHRDQGGETFRAIQEGCQGLIPFRLFSLKWPIPDGCKLIEKIMMMYGEARSKQ